MTNHMWQQLTKMMRSHHVRTSQMHRHPWTSLQCPNCDWDDDGDGEQIVVAQTPIVHHTYLLVSLSLFQS